MLECTNGRIVAERKGWEVNKFTGNKKSIRVYDKLGLQELQESEDGYPGGITKQARDQNDVARDEHTEHV